MYHHCRAQDNATVTFPSEDSTIRGAIGMRTEIKALVNMENIATGSKVTLRPTHRDGWDWANQLTIDPLKAKLKFYMRDANVGLNNHTAVTRKLGVEAEAEVAVKGRAHGPIYGL